MERCKQAIVTERIRLVFSCEQVNMFSLRCLRLVHGQVCFANDVFTAELVWIADSDPNAQAESVGRIPINLTSLKRFTDPVGCLLGMEGQGFVVGLWTVARI